MRYYKLDLTRRREPIEKARPGKLSLPPVDLLNVNASPPVKLTFRGKTMDSHAAPTHMMDTLLPHKPKINEKVTVHFPGSAPETHYVVPGGHPERGHRTVSTRPASVAEVKEHLSSHPDHKSVAVSLSDRRAAMPTPVSASQIKAQKQKQAAYDKQMAAANRPDNVLTHKSLVRKSERVEKIGRDSHNVVSELHEYRDAAGNEFRRSFDYKKGQKFSPPKQGIKKDIGFSFDPDRILKAHDVSDELRDGDGRWTSGAKLKATKPAKKPDSSIKSEFGTFIGDLKNMGRIRQHGRSAEKIAKDRANRSERVIEHEKTMQSLADRGVTVLSKTVSNPETGSGKEYAFQYKGKVYQPSGRYGLRGWYDMSKPDAAWSKVSMTGKPTPIVMSTIDYWDKNFDDIIASTHERHGVKAPVKAARAK
jgi:hypothetical protein